MRCATGFRASIPAVSLRSRMLGGFAAQLGKPTGLRGRFVGNMLNRANRGMTAAAVEALGLTPGATAADLGFGGGVGVTLLLEKVGPQGHVHAVDVSPTMVSRASSRFRREITNGRLLVQAGSITQLPLKDRSIQGAITINTIYFIEQLDRAFSELARVIAGSGRVVVGIGDPDAMAHMPMTPFGFRLRPVEDVVSVAKSVGLALQDHSRVGQGKGAAHLLVFAPAQAGVAVGIPSEAAAASNRSS
jgi:arsenite methyltransferase